MHQRSNIKESKSKYPRVLKEVEKLLEAGLNLPYLRQFPGLARYLEYQRMEWNDCALVYVENEFRFQLVWLPDGGMHDYRSSIQAMVCTAMKLLEISHCHNGPTGGHHECKPHSRKDLLTPDSLPTIFKDAH
ncbi:reverse transcriptase domain-containing protein [Tanacetum coccineum]|uniref:Reverse transcriptase domain-containing protein n=1 Tax=Tanacetum coccineum TaxID=301880 RepID=A0ABQ5C0L4_9ASTR